MNLVNLDTFNAKCFPENPISTAKLQRLCREGKLPARKVGCEWFIDLDQFSEGQAQEKKPDVSSIAQRVVDRMRNRKV